MFRKTILAAVAATALTFTPGLGTGQANANPPYSYRYHHGYYPAPVIVTPVVSVVTPVVVTPVVPVVVTPVVPVVTPVVVTPACHQYDVYFRPNCNAPWQLGGCFTSRYGAEHRLGFYQAQNFEGYIAVR
jgi:hypothetical protein